jgi:glycosyltransferase involved in cell wall biosynthesis
MTNSSDKPSISTDSPLFSVVTPVLNGVKYLETCIQSVLNQSYPHIEHVFVDGGSSDGTLEILSSYHAKYPERIRFISEPDKKAGEAWHKGLGIAKGQILGWLGSDDTYEPNAVMVVVEFFRANPDAYFVFGDCNFIDEKGEIIGRYRSRDFNLREAINDTCYIPCTSAFYKREVINKIGLLDTRETGVELDYWIRTGKIFKLYRIEEVLSNFRKHQGSVSGDREASKMYAREGFAVSRRHGGSIFSRRARRHLMYKSVILVWALPVMISVYLFLKRGIKKLWTMNR